MGTPQNATTMPYGGFLTNLLLDWIGNQLIKISSKRKPKRKRGTSNQQTDGRELPCPYKLLKKYLALRGEYKSKTEPFFVFADHSLVRPVHVRKCFKLMLKLANFQHPQFSLVHGICAGRSCNLLQLGLSIEAIKIIGRWQSNAVYRYLK